MLNIDKSLQLKAINNIVSSENKTDETKLFYTDMLIKIQNEEERLNKNFYQFRYDEIVSMLQSWNVTTVRSIKTINTILNYYLEFYIKQGMITGEEATFLSVSDLASCCVIDDDESMYFTSYREYIHFVQSFCYNSQDAVIYVLLFEGVRGIDHQEIKNLKEIDCDFKTNTLKLTQSKDGLEESRYLKVNEFTMQVIHDAIHDDMYYKNNGDVADGNKTEYFYIERNGYVVRSTMRYSDEAVGTHTIQQRVRKLSRLYGKQRLNPKNVFYSGMILKLKDIENQNGIVTNEDFKNINKHYNISTKTWDSTKRLYDSVKDSFN